MSERQDLDQLGLIRKVYEEEIIGEAMYVCLESLAEDEHQRHVSRLLAELERATGDLLLPVVLRHGVEYDREAAWREGQAFTQRSAQEGWTAYFEAVLPLAEAALVGMESLHELSDELDREATGRLVAHEQAFLEFVRRELDGAADSVEPLERFLADQRGESLPD